MPCGIDNNLHLNPKRLIGPNQSDIDNGLDVFNYNTISNRINTRW